MIFVLALAFSNVFAEVPQMINYQGKITKTSGALIDTTVEMIFTIYDAATDGGVLWADTQSAVVVEKGVFSTLLGSVNPIPDSVFDGNVRYLGIKVGADPEMTPRKEMVSVAYAYRSGADGDWTIDGDNIYRLDGNVGIGTDDPDTKLDVVGGAFWVRTHAMGGSGCRIDGNTITGTGVNAPGYNPLHIKLGDTSSSVLLAEDGGNVGIGTNDPATKLQVEGGALWVITNIMGGVGCRIEGNTITGTGVNAPGYNPLHIKTIDNSSDVLLAEDGGNVGIGTTSPQGALDVSSTTGALIVPRMSTAQRNALTAVNGMIIYNTSTNQFNFYENGAWVTK